MSAYQWTLETINFYTKEKRLLVFSPELDITAETGLWQESEGGILSFRTPQLGQFRDIGKKNFFMKNTFLCTACKGSSSSCS